MSRSAATSLLVAAALLLSPAAARADAKPAPLEVAVGFYFLDVAKVDLRSNEFYADFYVWYKWKSDSAEAWSLKNVEYMNGQIESKTEPAHTTLPDGTRLVSRRVKGVFRARFDFRRYPFDRQRLEVQIEDNTNMADSVVFVPDRSPGAAARMLDERAIVPGFRIAGSDVEVDVHAYGTGFGDDRERSGERYSRVAAVFTLERQFVPHLIKFVIPLLVIAGMAYLVFFINAKEFEAQCGICVTSLLSAVALHISQADALPAVGYLVVADKIFILFYVVIFSALVETVVVNNYAKRAHYGAAERIDEAFKFIYPAALAAGSLGLAMI